MSDERVERFVEAVKDDPRVLGVTRVGGSFHPGPALRVVTTWDGYTSLPAELRRLGAALLPDGPLVDVLDEARAHWSGMSIDGVRASISLGRVADLKPRDPDEPADTVVWDPHGFIASWIACVAKPTTQSADRGAYVILAAGFADVLERRMTETGDGISTRARNMLDRLRADDPIAARVRARLAGALPQLTRAGRGERIRGAERFESFLGIADDEGFTGDRVLFTAATARLRSLAKREPAFDHGFFVPTFDLVEAAFALGEAVGGCKPPLVPGVYVGVDVTPADALELWAAPFVRVATSSVACVDDTGERDAVVRTAGRDATLAALTSAVDEAWERLPALIESARAAAEESVDPAALLASLHLPRSFVERAKRRGADALMSSRLSVALALCAAGEGTAPLVARKLGFAAGRALAKR